MKKFFLVPELYLALLLAILGGLIHWGEPSFEQVRVLQRGVWSKTTIPFSAQDMPEGERFSMEMNVRPGLFKSDYIVHFYPVECVETFLINGKPLPMALVAGRCDRNVGFSLNHDAFQAFSPGKDRFGLRLDLKSSPEGGGLMVTLETDHTLTFILNAVFFIALLTLSICLARRFRCPVSLFLLIALGVMIRVVYIQATPFDVRGHDVEDHVAYVEIVAQQHRIPQATDCWTCYHPPLYFVQMVPTWTLAKALDFSAPRALQWHTLVFSIFTLVFGLLCLRLFLPKGGAFGVAGLLWAIWPGLVLASPRIGNDALFYLAHILCLWGCLKYLQEQSSRHLLVATLAAGVAFWTKTTGAITIAIWGMTLLMGYFPRPRLRPSRGEVASILIFAGLLLSIAFYFLGNPIVGNAGGLHHELRVGNQPVNFLLFDIYNFLIEPYTNPWADGFGRESFWNYLIKTSLFGEYRLLDNPAGIWLASIISVCFLILTGFAAVGLWRTKCSRESLLLLGQGLLFIAALAMLRMKVPYACSNDFRYIVPALLSFTPFVGTGIFADNASLRRKIAGVATVIVFAVCCLIMLVLVDAGEAP